jgi:hypothetical protein
MASTRTAVIVRRVIAPLMVVAGIAGVVATRSGASGPSPERAAIRVAAVPPSTTTPTSTAPKVAKVVLWGDSLAWEARGEFLAAFAGRAGPHVETRTLGGTAPCDWEHEMDAQAGRIGLAVLEFSGNSWTDCMRNPVTGEFLRDDALLAKYEHDVTAAAAEFTRLGTEVLLIGAPRPGDDSNSSMSRVHVRALYQALAARLPGVAFADAGAAVLDAGTFTPTLPCLPFEDSSIGCHDGRIDVRAPDGLHLCPWPAPAVDPFVGRCPIYSSGAYRFGHAIHDAVVAALQDGADEPARVRRSTTPQQARAH